MVEFLPSLRRRGRPAGLPVAEEKSLAAIAYSRWYSDLDRLGVQHHQAKDWPVDRAVVEGFERIVWVYKSVNTIGEDSCRLPYRLAEGDPEDGNIVDDHPLYRVLNKRANALEPGPVFRKRLSAQVCLSKRGAFVEYVKSNAKTIKEAHLLPPDRTEIIPGRGGDLINHFRLTRRDGSVKNIDPDMVRWFRDPHPLDPYMGMTPLEPSGLSTELDHFARLYNVAFMRNDGRPGGVLAVRDTKGGSDISPEHMDRLERKFSKGPAEAGALSVVAGELSYADLAARPRDMAYGTTARNAKIEILSAFGVPESVMGYSAERTWDNADNELYVYWTRTQLSHQNILVAGFDEDSDDDLNGFFDTSTVEVLERAKRARRQEAKAEVEAGLRSIKSYADLAGYGDEIDDTPHTRALYVATGRTPLPSREADAEALGLGTPVVPAAPPPADGQERQPPQDEPGAVDTAPPAPPEPPTGSLGGRSAADVLAAVAGTKSVVIPGPKAGLRLLRKVTDRRTSDPDLEAVDAFEREVVAVLDGLQERWVERTAVRLWSPKQRKHTRHWEPEYDQDTRVGTKALDVPRAVDELTWQQEAEAALRPLVVAAATAVAWRLITDLGGDPPSGVSDDGYASQAVAPTVTTVLGLVRRAVTTRAMHVTRLLNIADQAGEPLARIAESVRDEDWSRWVRGVAVQVATATSNGARDAAAREVNRDEAVQIDRTWVSRRDAKVRSTHAKVSGADGQTRGLDEPFIVGDTLVRFPGDPLAPLGETANCRCFLRHRARRTGRFIAAPGTD